MSKKINIQSTNFHKIIRNDVEGSILEYKSQVINTMMYIGEKVVETARNMGSYNDITGNLRSSIGYTILEDGKPIKLFSLKIVKNGDEGARKAEELLNSMKYKYPSGIVLIICAGMEYGYHVEVVHHRDVLTSAELEMVRLSDKLIKSIFK